VGISSRACYRPAVTTLPICLGSALALLIGLWPLVRALRGLRRTRRLIDSGRFAYELEGPGGRFSGRYDERDLESVCALVDALVAAGAPSH